MISMYDFGYPPDRIFTVFPHDEDEPWMDFDTYAEAKEYGDETFGHGNYDIEWT